MSRSLFEPGFLRVLLRRTATVRRLFVKENLRFSSDLAVNHRLLIDPSCKAKLNNGVKHRRHPGIQTLKTVKLPTKLQDATSLLIEKYPIKDLTRKSEQIVRYLWSRHIPIENDVVLEKARQLEAEFVQEEGVDVTALSSEDRNNLQNKIKSRVLSVLRKLVYHWEPIRYDAYRSFLYLVGRLAFDYSAIVRVLSEISTRTDFQPQTVFHFGSGVGSTIWAANSIWSSGIRENLCCDVSDDMNTLARLLLQGGKEDGEMCIPGVYFRQYFPASPKTKYDLAVSAFSLNELPNREERRKIVEALWAKTQQFLVLVENGTNTGFSLVNEARDFILELNSIGCEEASSQGTESSSVSNVGHVFAPCPHDNVCPRVGRQNGTPCNFDVDFQNLSSCSTKPEKARISFVILRRGSREDYLTESWPRIVRPVSTPSRCVHLQMCAPSGHLEYSAVTAAKHGRDLYWCARASQWGDLLPVIYQTEEDVTSRSDEQPCENIFEKNFESGQLPNEDKAISLHPTPDVV